MVQFQPGLEVTSTRNYLVLFFYSFSMELPCLNPKRSLGTAKTSRIVQLLFNLIVYALYCRLWMH